MRTNYAYREAHAGANRASFNAKHYREQYLGLRKQMREWFKENGGCPEELKKSLGVR